MNLFENILNTAKSGVNYLKSGQLGADLYDSTHNADPTQTLQYKAIKGIADTTSQVTGQGMEDPTQSLLYKGVQGGANLYTGAKEKLQSVEQTGKSEFDNAMSKKRQQFISDMLAEGNSEEDIFQALDNLKAKGEFDYKPGFGARLATGLSNRMQEAQNTTERLANEGFDPLAGKVTAKGIITAPLSYAGDIAGTAGDVIGATIEPIVSPIVKKIAETTGQTQNIQEIGKWWDSVKQSNPNFADAIEGVVNFGSIIPGVKGGQAGVQTLKETGKQTIKQAEKIIPKAVQGTKNIAESTKNIVKNTAEYVSPKKIEIPAGLSKTEQDALRTISPESFTPSELEALKNAPVQKVKTGKGISGEKVTYIPDKQDVEIAKTASPYLKRGASTSDNIEHLRKAISEEGNALESAIKEQNPIIPKRKVESHIKKAINEMMDDPEMVGDNALIAQKLANKYKAMLNEEGGTAMGVLKARKRFDEYVRSVKPKAFDAPTGRAYETAVKVIRDNANELLDSLVLNKSAKASLKKQHLLYKAREMIASKKDISKVGKILKSPITKIAGGAALGSAGVGVISNL